MSRLRGPFHGIKTRFSAAGEARKSGHAGKWTAHQQETKGKLPQNLWQIQAKICCQSRPRVEAGQEAGRADLRVEGVGHICHRLSCVAAGGQLPIHHSPAVSQGIGLRCKYMERALLSLLSANNIIEISTINVIGMLGASSFPGRHW
jgi:hypothetical protein